jgi:hypothetical protein
VSPVNLELVTLTEHRAIITWYTGYTGTDDGLGRMEPAPADGVVHLGTDPQRLNRVAGDRSRDTPYHYVELTGLEPGRTYYYQARSNDMRSAYPFTLISGNAVGTSDFGLTTGGPYSFTFPNRRRAASSSIVLSNDLHMGETTAGLLGGSSIPGIQQAPGLPPYPEVMLRSLVEDASALGGSFLLAAGDITAEAAPVDLSNAGKLLRRFGKYRRDYFVTRGNHDRAHTGEEYAACRVGQWQGNDCFHDQYFPGEPTYPSRELQGLGSSDSTPTTSLDAQRCRRALRGSARRFRASSPGNAISRPSCSAIIPHRRSRRSQPREQHARRRTVATILDDYAQTPGCSCITRATHRNKRTLVRSRPGTMQEIAAGKEYPGGFSPAALHQRLRVELLQDAADSPRHGANAAGRRYRSLAPVCARRQRVHRNAVVARSLRPARRSAQPTEVALRLHPALPRPSEVCAAGTARRTRHEIAGASPSEMTADYGPIRSCRKIRRHAHGSA